ncbi:hypothetical protein HELRODRAFT_181386 [Helobdella robusta]|uniref:Tudor domain-containing protein n=1 Tax=Helobdella robusta TaxID=6412 RepID=T1FGY3_HELRO|nr:hypothetical protein HELRODRAFT_181386 [Helobdella robusta]ESN92511.1 hypothetical protein HELRODRAFT_181386 [Helobdella robusta]
MKIRSGILPRLKQLKLPEEFIVEDQNGCDVTLRSFIQWQRMHARLWLKLPEELIMEDVRLRSFSGKEYTPGWDTFYSFFSVFLCNLTLRGLAPVLEDIVGTGKHSTFCLCRMDDVNGRCNGVNKDFSTISELEKEYRSLTNNAIPYQSLGFRSVLELLKSFSKSDVEFKTMNNMVYCRAIVNSKTSQVNRSFINDPMFVQKLEIIELLKSFRNGLKLEHFHEAFGKRFGRYLNIHISEILGYLKEIPEAVYLRREQGYIVIYPAVMMTTNQRTLPSNAAQTRPNRNNNNNNNNNKINNISLASSPDNNNNVNVIVQASAMKTSTITTTAISGLSDIVSTLNKEECLWFFDTGHFNSIDQSSNSTGDFINFPELALANSDMLLCKMMDYLSNEYVSRGKILIKLKPYLDPQTNILYNTEYILNDSVVDNIIISNNNNGIDVINKSGDVIINGSKDDDDVNDDNSDVINDNNNNYYNNNINNKTTTKYKEHLLKYPKMYEIMVCEVNREDECFYFQLSEQSSNIDKIMDDLQTFYESKVGSLYRVPTSYIKVGLVCVSLFDGVWHRCVVLHVHYDSVQIHYVDFGTRGTVPKQELRFLRKCFFTMEMQGLKGRFYQTKPAKNGRWSAEAFDYIFNYVSERTLNTVILGFDDDGNYLLKLLYAPYNLDDDNNNNYINNNNNNYNNNTDNKINSNNDLIAFNFFNDVLIAKGYAVHKDDLTREQLRAKMNIFDDVSTDDDDDDDDNYTNTSNDDGDDDDSDGKVGSGDVRSRNKAGRPMAEEIVIKVPKNNIIKHHKLAKDEYEATLINLNDTGYMASCDVSSFLWDDDVDAFPIVILTKTMRQLSIHLHTHPYLFHILMRDVPRLRKNNNGDMACITLYDLDEYNYYFYFFLHQQQQQNRLSSHQQLQNQEQGPHQLPQQQHQQHNEQLFENLRQFFQKEQLLQQQRQQLSQQIAQLTAEEKVQLAQQLVQFYHTANAAVTSTASANLERPVGPELNTLSLALSSTNDNNINNDSNIFSSYYNINKNIIAADTNIYSSNYNAISNSNSSTNSIVTPTEPKYLLVIPNNNNISNGNLLYVNNNTPVNNNPSGLIGFQQHQQQLNYPVQYLQQQQFIPQQQPQQFQNFYHYPVCNRSILIPQQYQMLQQPPTFQQQQPIFQQTQQLPNVISHQQQNVMSQQQKQNVVLQQQQQQQQYQRAMLKDLTYQHPVNQSILTTSQQSLQQNLISRSSNQILSHRLVDFTKKRI